MCLLSVAHAGRRLRARRRRGLRLGLCVTLYAYYCLDLFSLVERRRPRRWAGLIEAAALFSLIAATPDPLARAQPARMCDERREFISCVADVPSLLVSSSLLARRPLIHSNEGSLTSCHEFLDQTDSCLKSFFTQRSLSLCLQV